VFVEGAGHPQTQQLQPFAAPRVQGEGSRRLGLSAFARLATQNPCEPSWVPYQGLTGSIQARAHALQTATLGVVKVGEGPLTQSSRPLRDLSTLSMRTTKLPRYP